MTLTSAAEDPLTLPLSLNERICLTDEKMDAVIELLHAQARKIARLEERLRAVEAAVLQRRRADEPRQTSKL